MWSLFPYQTPLKEAITLFKYRGKLSLAKPLARALIEALPALPPVDIIIPVPLHPQRLREREYNQSLLLAARLSHHAGIPLLLACLLRVRPTVPQTSLSRKERLTNLRGAFSVAKPACIQSKRILLVDDVLTTGTTLHECAKTLRRAGSGPVYGLTLARMV
jgi:ComF family protein